MPLRPGKSWSSWRRLWTAADASPPATWSLLHPAAQQPARSCLRARRYAHTLPPASWAAASASNAFSANAKGPCKLVLLYCLLTCLLLLRAVVPCSRPEGECAWHSTTWRCRLLVFLSTLAADFFDGHLPFTVCSVQAEAGTAVTDSVNWDTTTWTKVCAEQLWRPHMRAAVKAPS